MCINQISGIEGVGYPDILARKLHDTVWRKIKIQQDSDNHQQPVRARSAVALSPYSPP